jgi:signal transduction histidine kinase
MNATGEQDLQKRLDQAEQALERSERRATASQYSGAIMHEVNNPLEAINNLVFLTQLQTDNPAQVIKNMQIIELQLDAIGRLTRRSLNYYREQDEAKEFDLVEIVESSLKLHDEKIVRHGVQVERRFSRPILVCVFGNEILQVLSNLVLNALAAMPREQGRLIIRVDANSRSNFITVSDNGHGIPDGLIKELFRPYVTGKSSGTGLGLWLSQRIIVRHQGTLRFRTSQHPDRCGTSFRISLPLRHAA